MTADDWLRHPIWSEYNNPEDLDGLRELGFDLDEVRSKLKAINYSQEYAFPVPENAAPASLWFMDYSARLTTPSGTNLVGYHTGPAIGAFSPCGQQFIFNINLGKECVEGGNALARLLREEAVFPFQVEITATRETFEFPWPSPPNMKPRSILGLYELLAQTKSAQ